MTFDEHDGSGKISPERSAKRHVNHLPRHQVVEAIKSEGKFFSDEAQLLAVPSPPKTSVVPFS
jgi:hypothetical protein